MPSVTYMNQSAPFWDFIASLEQQGSQHPMFAQNRNEETSNEQEHGSAQTHDGPPHPFAPWGFGQQLFGGGRGMPHRGPPQHQHEQGETVNEQNKDKNNEKDAEMRGQNDNGEGPSGASASDNESHAYGRSHPRRSGGWCGSSTRGPGPRHGRPHHGAGPHHHGGPGRRGGPWGRGGPFGGFGGAGPFGFGGNSFDPTAIAAQFWNQFVDAHSSNNTTNNNNTNNTNNDTDTKATPTDPEDHTPDADIFDTESAYVVHVSLPGAKKEDVGVNWDAEKSELSIAGVVYRPGDEDFLKTLAMSERKVGAFERKIRLGTRATPAQIDVDGITAKLEDGVLRVEVPKLDAEYVEVRKVDIE